MRNHSLPRRTAPACVILLSAGRVSCGAAVFAQDAKNATRANGGTQGREWRRHLPDRGHVTSPHVAKSAVLALSDLAQP